MRRNSALGQPPLNLDPLSAVLTARHHMNPPALALRAAQAKRERLHRWMLWLIVNVYVRAVVAVQARHGQSPYAVLSHVGEVHRRAATALLVQINAY